MAVPAVRARSPRTADSQRAARSRRSVPGSCSDSTCTRTTVRCAVISRRIDASSVSSPDVGGDGRRLALATVVAQPQRLDRPARIDRGLEHRRPEPPVRRDRTRSCPPGRRRPSGLPAAAPRSWRPHRGSRRRLSRSIGMTFISRARNPSPGQLTISALGDERARHDRADREDVHPRHMAADHEHALQIANRPPGHRDSHTQAAQHQPAVAALDVGATRDGNGQQRHGRQQQDREGGAYRDAPRDDHALAGRRPGCSDAAGVTRGARQPGTARSHDAIPSAIAAAAPTDLSRRRYRVSACRLSSRAGKSPTPKSGSWAGSPHTWAPSLR